jgi:hypothetical protein
MEDATDDEVVALAVTLAQRLSEVPLGDLSVDFEIDRDSVIIARAALLMGEIIENGSEEERAEVLHVLGLQCLPPAAKTRAACLCCTPPVLRGPKVRPSGYENPDGGVGWCRNVSLSRPDLALVDVVVTVRAA